MSAIGLFIDRNKNLSLTNRGRGQNRNLDVNRQNGAIKENPSCHVLVSLYISTL